MSAVEEISDAHDSTVHAAGTTATTKQARTVWTGYAAGMGALVLILLAVQGDAYWLNILILTLMFAGLAASWNIIGGFGGQLSLGHGVFFAIGAYTVGITYDRYDWSPWLAMVVAIPIAVVVAGLTSWPTFRLRGPFFAMATLALNQVALVMATFFDEVTGGVQGITLAFSPSLRDFAFIERWKYAVVMLVYVAIAVAVAVVISRSRLGYALRAVREDDEAAAAVGFNVFAVKMRGMLISAALTSIGGSLFAVFVRYIDPASVLSLPEVGVRIVLVALLGGIGTLMGPVVGALLFIPAITLLQGGLAGQAPGLNLVAVGLLLVVIPIALRRGIVGTTAGLVRSARGRWSK
ncbi:MAG: branched-chain amino acid ABC transporter permease [Actinomycetota bacterium]|nr:branched-chain amino acid ABC transporter permease [Actinomycetota bacterium]